MAGPVSDLELQGWDRFRKAVDAKVFAWKLDNEIRDATEANLAAARSEVILGIQRGDFAPLAPMTVEHKGGEAKVFASAEANLFNSITTEVDEDGRGGRVGVMRQSGISEGGKTRDIRNVARILHEGWSKSIVVTNKMRAFFRAMAEKYPGRWRPLAASTKIIRRMPSRPFMAVAVSPKMIASYRKRWSEAVKTALALAAASKR